MSFQENIEILIDIWHIFLILTSKQDCVSWFSKIYELGIFLSFFFKVWWNLMYIELKCLLRYITEAKILFPLYWLNIFLICGIRCYVVCFLCLFVLVFFVFVFSFTICLGGEPYKVLHCYWLICFLGLFLIYRFPFPVSPYFFFHFLKKLVCILLYIALVAYNIFLSPPFSPENCMKW